MSALRNAITGLAALFAAALTSGCVAAGPDTVGVDLWDGAYDVRILPRGRSKGWRTGGLSGLEWDPQSEKLLAISDRGQVFQLSTDGKGLAEHVARLKTPRQMRDAEAIRRTPEGGWLIVYEDENAVAYYPGAPDRLGQKPAWVRVIGADGGSTHNRGFESMALLDFGRLLLIAEGGTGGSDAFVFDMGANGRGSVTRRTYPSADDYSPVDAVAAPNGDVLILERRFHGLAPPFFSARIARIPAASLDDGASGPLRVEGRVQLTPPIQHENWEGMAIAPSPTGPRLWLVSDDNLQWPQATLLANLDLAEVLAALIPE